MALTLHFAPERSVQNYTHNTKPFWYGFAVRGERLVTSYHLHTNTKQYVTNSFPIAEIFFKQVLA